MQLADNKVLFGYICGTQPDADSPSDADREGFRRAAELLRTLLRREGRIDNV